MGSNKQNNMKDSFNLRRLRISWYISKRLASVNPHKILDRKVSGLAKVCEMKPGVEIRGSILT